MADTKGYPTNFPTEAVTYLIGVLRGTQKLALEDGIRYGYQVTGYLLGRFFGSDEPVLVGAVSPLKEKRVKDEKVAAALQALSEARNGARAKGAVAAAWLIPILVNLIRKWLAQKGEQGSGLPA